VLHAGRVRGKTIAVAAAALAAGLATGAAAGAEDGLVSEVKFGVRYHDVGLFDTRSEEGVDLNAEVLFAPLEPLAFVWSPRPHLGAHVNTSGDTSQLYFGLTWTFDLTDRFWVAFGGGGAVHNGKLTTGSGEDLQLGSAAQFR
jgi:lipid A 3-O-deacylase